MRNPYQPDVDAILAFMAAEHRRHTVKTQQKNIPGRMANMKNLPSDPEKIHSALGNLQQGIRNPEKSSFIRQLAYRMNRRDNNVRDAVGWSPVNGQIPSKEPEIDENGSVKGWSPPRSWDPDLPPGERAGTPRVGLKEDITAAGIAAYKELAGTDPPPNALIKSDGVVSDLNGNNAKKFSTLDLPTIKDIVFDADHHMDNDLGLVDAARNVIISLALGEYHSDGREIFQQWHLLEKNLSGKKLRDISLEERKNLLRIVTGQAITTGSIDNTSMFIPEGDPIFSWPGPTNLDIDNKREREQTVVQIIEAETIEPTLTKGILENTVNIMAESLANMDGDIDLITGIKFAAKSIGNRKKSGGNLGNVNWPWETTSNVIETLLLDAVIPIDEGTKKLIQAYKRDEKFTGDIDSRWDVFVKSNIDPLVESITKWYEATNEDVVRTPPQQSIDELRTVLFGPLAKTRRGFIAHGQARIAMALSLSRTFNNKNIDKRTRASLAVQLIEAFRQEDKLPEGSNWNNLPSDADGLIKHGIYLTEHMKKHHPKMLESLDIASDPHWRYKGSMLRLFKQTFPDAKTHDGKSIDTYDDYKAYITDMFWNPGNYSKETQLMTYTLFNASNEAFSGLIPKDGDMNATQSRDLRYTAILHEMAAGGYVSSPLEDSTNPFNLVLGGAGADVYRAVANGHHQEARRDTYDLMLRNYFMPNFLDMAMGSKLLINPETGEPLADNQASQIARNLFSQFLRDDIGGGIDWDYFNSSGTVEKAAFVQTIIQLDEQTGGLAITKDVKKHLLAGLTDLDSAALAGGGDAKATHRLGQTLGWIKYMLYNQAGQGGISPKQNRRFIKDMFDIQEEDLIWMELLIGEISNNAETAGLLSTTTTVDKISDQSSGQLNTVAIRLIEKLQDSIGETTNTTITPDKSLKSVLTNTSTLLVGAEGAAQRAELEKDMGSSGITYEANAIEQWKLAGIHIPKDAEGKKKIVDQMKRMNLLDQNVDTGISDTHKILGGLATLSRDRERLSYLLASGSLNTDRDISMGMDQILLMSAFRLGYQRPTVSTPTGQPITVRPHGIDLTDLKDPLENAGVEELDTTLSPETFKDQLDTATGWGVNPHTDWIAPVRPQRHPGELTWRDRATMVAEQRQDYPELSEEDYRNEQDRRDALIQRRLLSMITEENGDIIVGTKVLDPKGMEEAMREAFNRANDPKRFYERGRNTLDEGSVSTGFWDAAWAFTEGAVGFNQLSNMGVVQDYFHPAAREARFSLRSEDYIMTALYLYMKKNNIPKLGQISVGALEANVEAHRGVFWSHGTISIHDTVGRDHTRLTWDVPGGQPISVKLPPRINIPYLAEEEHRILNQ